MEMDVEEVQVIGNKKEFAYNTILKRIVNNELKPMSSLTEQSLCKEMGISKTPVREALKDLEKDGFVQIIPNRGCFVSTISLEYIREIFEIREILECAAARLAAIRADKTQFVDILNYHESFADADKDSMKDRLVSGYQIHMKIVESIENSRLTKQYVMLQNHIVRIRLFFIRQFDLVRLHETKEEHRNILEAIVSGNPVAAEATMKEHLRNSQDRIKSLI
jgi:DNA-binding GntR family transcriptional regulator